MNDKLSIYYEAYYGAPIPLSQSNRIEKQFTEMVKTIKADIINHLPNAEESQVKAGILEALLYLQSTGMVQSPDLYLRNPNCATEAFRYAIAATEGRPLRRERTPQEVTAALEHERQATLAALEEDRQRNIERADATAPIYREYHKVKAILVNNGESMKDARIGAYKALLNTCNYEAGVAWYVIGIKLPCEEGIADEPEVMEAIKARREFANLEVGVFRMQVNGKAWGGLHHESRTD